MKAQVTAIAIMALMALSTPGTSADSAVPGSESDAQCLLMGEPIGPVLGDVLDMTPLNEDPRDVVCELDDGTVLECEDIGDNLYACVMGDGELGCALDECEDAICVAEGGDVWTCTGTTVPDPGDPCRFLNDCQVQNPCELANDCDVGAVPCIDTHCDLPELCGNPDDCDIDPSGAGDHLKAEKCEASIFGAVCATAHGFATVSPASDCETNRPNDVCVRFHTSWSGKATLEDVTAVMYDAHTAGASCSSSGVFVTRFCSDQRTAYVWHDDFASVFNEIDVAATGYITGTSALAEYNAGPGC